MKKRTLQMIILLCCIICLFCSCSRPDAQNAEKAEGENTADAPGEAFDLDAFYQSPMAQQYEDIRDLDSSYNQEQAQADHCFVIGAMVHNDNLYSEFMSNVQNHKDAFIRVVQSTVEGDAIIIDILYDSGEDNVYLVHDGTRDKFAAEADRTITLREYDNVAEYSFEQHLYWIAYNGEIEDVDLDSADTFVITMIN